MKDHSVSALAPVSAPYCKIRVHTPGRYMRAVFLIIILAGPFALFSQGYLKGDAIGSISIGLTHVNKSLVKYNTRTESFKKNFRGDLKVGTIKGVNPVGFKYEYAFGKNFGLGLSLACWTILIDLKDSYKVPPPAYSSNTNMINVIDSYHYKLGSISFGIRPNYHFTLGNKRGDLFIGCAVGFTKNNASLNFSTNYNTGIYPYRYYEGSSPMALYLAPGLGYRYFVSPGFGFNVEAGYEKGALFQAGITFRFRPFKYERPA